MIVSVNRYDQLPLDRDDSDGYSFRMPDSCIVLTSYR